MNYLQYKFHKIIISKYNNLYKLLVFIIIYLFLCPSTYVFCMTENPNTEILDLAELIEEQQQVNRTLLPVLEESKEIELNLLNKEKEKQEIIDHYTFLLNEEAKKTLSYQSRAEILEHENTVLRNNQDLLIRQKRGYQLELYQAKLIIANLTGENLDLRLDLAEQKRILQGVAILAPRENEELRNMVVEITNNSSPLKKRK